MAWRWGLGEGERQNAQPGQRTDGQALPEPGTPRRLRAPAVQADGTKHRGPDGAMGETRGSPRQFYSLRVQAQGTGCQASGEALLRNGSVFSRYFRLP